MYAIISIPGSSKFQAWGPAKPKDCEEFLAATRQAFDARGEQMPSSRIISNKEAKSYRYQDGTPVIREDDV